MPLQARFSSSKSYMLTKDRNNIVEDNLTKYVKNLFRLTKVNQSN